MLQVVFSLSKRLLFRRLPFVSTCFFFSFLRLPFLSFAVPIAGQDVLALVLGV